MTAPRPIEIVGGGLAGLSLGLALRRRGVPVRLFEAGDYPRHRVCGEFIAGLSPGTIERLALAPILSDALRHREVAWFHADRRVRLQRLPAPALGLSRHTLDARLAGAFTQAGGVLHPHTRITDDAAPPGRVFAVGRRRTETAWLGLKVHALDLPLDRDLELHLGENAYAGLSRVEAGRVNVCGLFRRRDVRAKGPALLTAYLRAAGLTALAQRVAAGQPDPGSFCAVAAVPFADRVPAADTRAVLGDASAAIPPFTGHGMAMAFQSAELALDPLVAYAQDGLDWPSACRRLHDGLHRRFRFRLAAAGALHPFLVGPRRQQWLARLARLRLLPFRPLYAALH
jgi:2-polyprenyl-6-methoxyphenol hydroxylase-like FAD-dependent oxidoreductase